MCGRFAFFSPAEAVRRAFASLGTLDLARLPPPRWNIAPTQPVAAIRDDGRGGYEAVPLRWGLVPAWAKDLAIGQRMINARSETVHEKPAFRQAWRRRRCLVLADGWYEWQAGARGKQPWFLALPGGSPFAIAGLWERWQDPAGEPVESCTLLTAPALPAIAAIHDRMPVVLTPAGAARWLAHGTPPEELAALAQPAVDVTAWPVSRAVNDAHHEGADLVRPLPAPDGG